MKNFKKTQITVTAIIAVLAFAFLASDISTMSFMPASADVAERSTQVMQNNLKMNLIMDKTSYRVGENVDVNLSVENLTDREIYTGSLSYGYVVSNENNTMDFMLGINELYDEKTPYVFGAGKENQITPLKWDGTLYKTVIIEDPQTGKTSVTVESLKATPGTYKIKAFLNTDERLESIERIIVMVQ